MIEIWRENNDIVSNHKIPYINNDKRTPILISVLKNMKETKKRKIKDDLIIVYNSTILTLARAESNVDGLWYKGKSHDIIIVPQDTDVIFKE
tara:strand:+ start:27 stop:302 length:276 start_codon:yes stop_codon:yes gene_type:complete